MAEQRSSEGSEEEGTPKARADGDRADGGTDGGTDGDAPLAGDMPPMDFSIFLLSLNTSALMHLGHAAEGEGPVRVNLPMARQVIDIIAMLEEKTHGNLTGKEEQLLHQVLFDLRVRYARAAPSGSGR